jgi:RHS repeat-associated protein
VAKTNASSGGQKIGPSLVLRVMAGDTIQINATGVYNSTAANTSIATQPDMISAILNAFSGSGISDGVHGAFGIGSAISTGLTPGVFNSLKQIDTSQNLSTKPKAYLNFALFDDQFALVNDNSGVRQVQGNTNVLQALSVSRMVIKKTGFLYIYCSNESGSDVFFDNLVVTHNGGPVLEETHYYPFGLAMAGISNHALKGLNYPENRKKYNGIEFTDELDLNLYDAQLRNLDPQIGRWNEIDPKIENMEAWSPYASNYNNPIRYNDFLGDEPESGEGDPPLSTKIFKGTQRAALVVNLLGGGPADPVADVASTVIEVGGTIAAVTALGIETYQDTQQKRQEQQAQTANSPTKAPEGLPFPLLGNVPALPLQERLFASQKKERKDLVQEAKDAQAKEAAAKERTDKRENATREGNNRTGNSNQEVRGDHNKNASKSKSDKHSEANARRAREQKAADERKKN